ncbi:polysaccharide export outer membrane protein [Loktanella fryxellensis]|uniref:Polysaccharide export outer membrane protein n=1 Tax=Loktanella fryxellensis TaxID=245187 RepID=A0A1H7YY29_9RHOB|nr:polysaccharide biosynthesis/export family protein [Loktanella fryxellensis]SEM51056.1 polysaccharide export outer membrane protein [Loktanella fryxellensis]
MLYPTLRPIRGATLLLTAGLLAACALPRVGPNKSEIFAGSVLREGDAFVLTVDDRVNAIAAVAPALGFSAGFLNAGELGADTIRAGDTLGLTIFENVDDGLLVPTGANATAIEEVQVDAQGFIFVPYAGRVRAEGNSPEALRRVITERLAEQTPDPQVAINRLAGDGATVSVQGAVTAQGVYPIERPTRSLIPMLAAAGGVAVEPDIARVTIQRGDQRAEVFYDDLFASAANDIALRDGDAIVVKSDSRTFTALGATGAQDRITFESRTISAIEALAQVGGLSSTAADPTGVFVFRNEPEEIAEQLVGQDVTGPQRVVYVLDLTRPNGMFMARDFAIRDGDTVYVTEAPFVQFNKTIAALTGSLSAANGVQDATGL